MVENCFGCVRPNAPCLMNPFDQVGGSRNRRLSLLRVRWLSFGCWLLLAQICQTRAKRRYAAAAGFYADAFAAEPDLARYLPAGHRYNAACSAVLATSGQGQDDSKSDDKDRTCLRRQALDWLRADLAAWTKRVDGGKPVDRAAAVATLTRWQNDDDLAGVRHSWSLLRLPADERRQWQKLWADVDALLKRAQ